MLEKFNNFFFDDSKNNFNITSDSVPWFLVSCLKKYNLVSFLCNDNKELEELSSKLKVLCPNEVVLLFPSFDCPLFSNISPTNLNKALRIKTLSELSNLNTKRVIVLFTMESIFTDIIPKNTLKNKQLVINSHKDFRKFSREKIISFLEKNSYSRVDTVRQKGEYSIRGGILDIFSPSQKFPVRIDFFASEIESIKSFDIVTQLSYSLIYSTDFIPASEILINEKSIQNFRTKFREQKIRNKDEYYESVSQGIAIDGIEQFLSLLYENLENFLNYITQFKLIVKSNYLELLENLSTRLVSDFYDSFDSKKNINIYLKSHNEIVRKISELKLIKISTLINFENNNEILETTTHFKEVKKIKSKDDVIAFEKFAKEKINKFNIIIATKNNLSQKKIKKFFPNLLISNDDTSNVLVLDIDIKKSFITKSNNQKGLIVINYEDLFEKKIFRNTGKNIDVENIISEVSSLNEGDLIVHLEHGIGKYLGLKSIKVYDYYHECMEIEYYAGDKLLIPVENLDLISRYGNKDVQVSLDKLGSTNWQARKLAIKEKIKTIAHDLILLAAKREVKKGKIMLVDGDKYSSFASQFEYAETSDQLKAINDIEEDLASGKPMDRLICGDVGFGKTEIAMRAAFISSLSGYQVAFLCPTTLLTNQHFKSFLDRFKGFNTKIKKISRFDNTKEKNMIFSDIENHNIDIIIGTHALFNDQLKFKKLGLLIIDEEQNFGVEQKEKLKKLKSEVHILTLTATPIPRTLQSSILGIKDLSIIKTPPVNRLPIKTYLCKYNKNTIKSAISKEIKRKGQVFYVSPKIKDLEVIRNFFEKEMPEISCALVHGRLNNNEINKIYDSFFNKEIDVLISTSIIESGLDISNANTIIINKANYFGLSQLYQIRGRVGRSDSQAFAYLIIPENLSLSTNAVKRLEVIKSLDTLGAGFTLASHDMDIRGGGNLIGSQQSGHIREVGIELYQKLIKDAIDEIKENRDILSEWSPSINLGFSVFIPNDYIPDIQIRLTIYRRISNISSLEKLNEIVSELIDRFGSLPEELKNFIKIIEIKNLCKKANINKIDLGTKGFIITFNNNKLIDTKKLLNLVDKNPDILKLRPDNKLLYLNKFSDKNKKIIDIVNFLKILKRINNEK